MKYPYHDLYPQQFEKLVVAICSQILGMGVQEFSVGPDGGRDARFQGTAEKFPSSSGPYSGKFIIQAKHTIGISEKFSDSSFSGDAKSSDLSVEMPRIKALVKNNELNHYLLFSNRRMGGNACVEITDRIKQESGAENVHLIGIEALERLLKENPKAVSLAEIDPIDSPLRVSPDDLAHIILRFVKAVGTISKEKDWDDKIERIRLVEKNQTNNLSNDYANYIKKDIQNFAEIRNFLALPDNQELLDKYRAVTEEFQLEIMVHKKDYRSFDQILTYIFRLLTDRDSDLASNRSLTRRMLHYMYWNCDIGTEIHAETDKIFSS